MTPMRIYVGWDSREDIAYQVCKASIEAHASVPVQVLPIKQSVMRQRGLYWRAPDALSSTEFSITRFLTPHLAGYQGWAVFVDCDFLFRHDIAALLEYRDPAKALYCVQHDYRPTETLKMDGAVQTLYPRKNWSSFMYMNCAHEQFRALTPDVVNSQTALHLHRFNWLSDEVIGALPVAWNYLEGWYRPADCSDPIAVHYTRGGPWFEQWQHVEYAREWSAAAGDAGGSPWSPPSNRADIRSAYSASIS